MATDTPIRGFHPVAPKGARRGFVWAYLIAVGATAAACGLTWLLPDALHRPFFLFFIAAVGLSAWYGGWLPGLISVALGAIGSAYFFMAPGGSMTVLGPLDQIRLALFTISAVFMVWLFSTLRATRMELQHNADRFRRAQRSANIAAFDWELSTGRVFWSEELPVLKSLVSGDRVENWMAAFAAEDRNRLEGAVQQAIATGAEVNTDLRVPLPLGGTRWIAIRGQLSYDEHGEPLRILGVVVDITDRKAAESRLEAQHAITRALVESPHPAAAMPKVLCILCESLGWSFGQLWLMDPARGVLRAAVAWRRSAQLAQFERDNRPVTFARGVGLPGRVWASGQSTWVEDLSQEPDAGRRELFMRDGLCSALAFPIQLDSQVLGIMEVFSRQTRPADRELLQTAADIGAQMGQFIERRRIQDALRESEERYRTTLSSIADAVIATDAHGRVQFLNSVAQELTGWPQHEAAQCAVTEVFRVARESGSDSPADPVRRVLESSAPTSLREGAVLLARDGRHIPIDDSAAPIRNDVGELIGVVLVFRDVGARRRAEDALRSSEKLAATGRLAASIAHEINNPMEAVGNLLYLLDHHASLDDTAREYTRLAEQELGRMDKIVKQTLGFYRESAEPVPLRLTTVLDNVLELYARRIQKARVQVRRRYRFDGEVKGFPGEMRQVFSNLIANALDAVDQGGSVSVHITRSCDWTGPPRSGVRVTIADNGAGITRENLHRIFEPFFTTKGVNGTGLGLWVSYGILRKHGGRIRVRSSSTGRHSGTCFSVFLPDTMTASASPAGSADTAPATEAA